VVALVVAHSANRVIGRDGGLPWHLPGDLRRFRELTTGHAVVMGRRTYDSLPDAFRPLPGRRNVVLSADPAYRADGAEVVRDLGAALAGRCFVIGGGAVYAQALPHAQRVYATELEAEIDGDTFFPPLPAGEWRCVERGDRIIERGHAYRFTVHDRVG
jgi:dihydrofolate reductase